MLYFAQLRHIIFANCFNGDKFFCLHIFAENNFAVRSLSQLFDNFEASCYFPDTFWRLFRFLWFLLSLLWLCSCSFQFLLFRRRLTLLWFFCRLLFFFLLTHICNWNIGDTLWNSRAKILALIVDIKVRFIVWVKIIESLQCLCSHGNTLFDLSLFFCSELLKIS